MSARGLALALLVVALAVRVGTVLIDPTYELVGDVADYDRHARSVASGHGYPGSSVAAAAGPTAGRLPLYPYFLGAVYAVWPGDDVLGARLAQAVLGTATVALIGLIAFKLWGRGVGLVALGVGALFPPLIAIGAALLSEALFVPLLLAAVAATLAARERPGLRRPLAAGLLLGAAAMTRPAGLVLAVPLALGVWGGAARLSAASLARPALLIVVALLCCVPWAVRNAAAFDSGPLLSTQTGYVAGGTYNDASKDDPIYPAGWRPAVLDPDYAAAARDPRADELEIDRAWRAEAWKEIGSDPWYLAEVAFWNSARWLHLVQRGYPYTEDTGLDGGLVRAGVLGFLAALVPALTGIFTRRARAAPVWLWLCPVSLWGTTALLAGLIRYRAPIDPFFVILAALGLVAAWERLPPLDRQRPRRRVRTKHI